MSPWPKYLKPKIYLVLLTTYKFFCLLHYYMHVCIVTIRIKWKIFIPSSQGKVLPLILYCHGALMVLKSTTSLFESWKRNVYRRQLFTLTLILQKRLFLLLEYVTLQSQKSNISVEPRFKHIIIVLNLMKLTIHYQLDWAIWNYIRLIKFTLLPKKQSNSCQTIKPKLCTSHKKSTPIAFKGKRSSPDPFPEDLRNPMIVIIYCTLCGYFSLGTIYIKFKI